MDDLKLVLISFSLENSFLRIPRSLGWSTVNPDGNEQIKERVSHIRSVGGKMYNANARSTKQHTLVITK